MDNSDNKDNPTVIKPRSVDPTGKPIPPAAQDNATVIKKTGPSLDTGQAHALTQIGKSFQPGNSSTGFDKARQAANTALASNKIILNNRFVLDTIINGGGMGTVYKARDLRKVEANDANPYIAVKVLNQDFKNHPDAFVTLQREASRSQVLAHPNIVQVHDFDRDGDVIYMTMQLLEGRDLEAHIKAQANRGVPTDEALRIIKEYCAALIYAHDKNIVHSDLKPGNIFITRQGAKVLDFGIARLSAGTQAQDSFDAGSLGALTPAYASLEMFNGEEPDQSDDVYAVAVIAYELFSGKHPYQRKSAPDALKQNLKPERIATLSKRQWQALEAALKLHRSERTATVAEFLNQLTYTRKNLILKLAAVALLMITAVLSYFTFIAPDELSSAIASNLKKGSLCFEAQDFACSKESANAVLKMDPNNKTAKQLYETSAAAYLKAQITSTFDAAQACIQAGNIDCARANLSALSQLAPNSDLLGTLETKIQLKIAHTTAEACFAEKRFDCVLENTAAMLQLEPGNEFASDLSKKASELQTQDHARNTETLKKYNENMTAAEKCFAKNDYDCSMKYARQALTHKPGAAEAETLFQKSLYAQSRQQEAMTMAKNVLQQGEACLKQKNYSCAIAKSESALEFVPGLRDAIKLKQDAQQEVAKLKQSIKIE